MGKRHSLFTVLCCLFLSIVLSACGGGGGGDAAPSSSGITFTGATTQATVTNSNAETLALGAYQGAATIGTAVALGVVMSESLERPIYLDLSLTIREAMSQVDVYAPTGILDAGAMVSQSGTIAGSNGGNAQYTIQINDVTGDFSGTINFNNYTSNATRITGSCTFSGKINTSSNSMEKINISSDNMAVAAGGKSYTAKMTISLNAVSSTQFTITGDFVMRDNTTGKTYWVNNYNMTLWEKSSYVEVSLSGKYYDPDYGYIDTSTPTTLKIGSTANYPYDGILIATGKSGTKAKLTALSATSYKVDADANGDGTYEWTSSTKTW